MLPGTNCRNPRPHSWVKLPSAIRYSPCWCLAALSLSAWLSPTSSFLGEPRAVSNPPAKLCTSPGWREKQILKWSSDWSGVATGQQWLWRVGRRFWSADRTGIPVSNWVIAAPGEPRKANSALICISSQAKCTLSPCRGCNSTDSSRGKQGCIPVLLLSNRHINPQNHIYTHLEAPLRLDVSCLVMIQGIEQSLAKIVAACQSDCFHFIETCELQKQDRERDTELG